MAGEWSEEKHPRANDGKFGAGGAGGRAPRAQAVAKAAVGAKRGSKKAIERGYQHMVAGDFAKDPATRNREFGKAMEVFRANGHEPNSSAKGILAKHGYDAGQTESRPPTVKLTKASPKAATPAPPRSKAPRAIPDQAPANAKASGHAAEAAKIAASDGRRRAIAGDVHVAPGSSYYERTQWTPSGQQAVREHHAAVAAHYGLQNRDAASPEGRQIAVRTDEGMMMGGVQTNGSHSTDGKIEVRGAVADQLRKHAALDAAGMASIGKRAIAGDRDAGRMLEAYRVSTHEALHGMGPPVHMTGERQGTMIEEMATELVARKIAGDVHGLPVHAVPGSYSRYIEPAAEAVARLSGRSRDEAVTALADAALEFKRMTPGQYSASSRAMSVKYNKMIDDAEKAGRQDIHLIYRNDNLGTIGASALKKLGVSDAGAHDKLHTELEHIDQNQVAWDKKYPNEDRLK